MSRWQTCLWISLGAVLGANLRYLVGRGTAAWLGTNFPFGTFLVNVAGCLLAGFFGALIGARLAPRPDLLRSFVVIGFLGSLTTFSAFSYESVNLALEGAWMRAGLYVAASLLAGLAGVRLGMWAALQIRIP